jgi:hypothetical protein
LYRCCLLTTENLTGVYHLAQLMASSGWCTSSSSRWLSAMDCIFIRFYLTVFDSVSPWEVESSLCQRRVCVSIFCLPIKTQIWILWNMNYDLISQQIVSNFILIAWYLIYEGLAMLYICSVNCKVYKYKLKDTCVIL